MHGSEKIAITDLSGGVDAVVQGGFCIGCGACAAAVQIAGGDAAMVMSPMGLYQPDLKRLPANANSRQAMAMVCPFADSARDEDAIGAAAFMDTESQPHAKLGRVLSTFAGYAKVDELRQNGSSGGMGSWLASRLLRNGIVDAVLHVKAIELDGKQPLFGYHVSETVEEACQASKSRYYPVTLDQMVHLIREQDRRYAFVGIPCFVKAMRLLAEQDEVIRQRVVAHIGLVCGHMKTSAFAESLAWQMGVHPRDLVAFDFRKKLENGKASAYGVEAVGRVNGSLICRSSPVRSLFGYDWGVGVFKPKACDFCDDVMAETADVTIGDAWLPKYVNDDLGTNVIVVRSRLFADLIQQGIDNGELHIEPLTTDEAVQSQSSGFSHRREGLAYRLWVLDQRNEWRPRKRVQPAAGIHGPTFERRQTLRMQIADLSHIAFAEAKQAGDLRLYTRRLLPLIEEYRNLTRSPLKRVMAWVRLKLGVTRL